MKGAVGFAVVLTFALGIGGHPALASSVGPNGEICPEGEVWVAEHYVQIDGEWEEVPSGCAPPEYLEHVTFEEAPLDLGTVTVVGRRIVPSTFRITLSRPSPPPAPTWTTPGVAPLPPRPAPSRPRSQEVVYYSVGRCSRTLDLLGGGEYTAGLTSEQQAAIARRIDRHDDVMWSGTTESPSGGAWGSRYATSNDAAGFFAVSFLKALTLRDVDGEVRTPSPLPPQSACNSWKVEEANYERMLEKVAGDRANPPKYNLLTNNCQIWASNVLALAPRN